MAQLANILPHKTLAIAIVDDHPVFRRILSHSLLRLFPGCQISEADNGKDFLELLESHNYDLVLMDVKMPVMDGIEATSIAVGMHPELKILALSMHDDPEFLGAMQRAGARGYLVKGGDLKAIERAILQVLAGQPYFYPN